MLMENYEIENYMIEYRWKRSLVFVFCNKLYFFQAKNWFKRTGILEEAQ